MKRDYTSHETVPVDDILRDISQPQLAAIGAVALSYNYAESTIHRMGFLCVGMPIRLWRPVISRINGLEGIIEIVKLGAKERLQLDKQHQDFLAETLGDGGFKLLKKYRDAAIHARIVNRVTGVGELTERRGKHVQVLLTEDALLGLYHRLEAVRMELVGLFAIMDAAYWLIIAPDDPDTKRYAKEIPECFALARQYRQKRLSLPPLPEFPDEAQLRELESRDAALPQQTMTGVLSLDIGSPSSRRED